MSRPGRLVRALPALLRIGWKDNLAYRAELLVWMLSMTMPLVMLALYRAVAGDGKVGPFDAAGFTAYFLATLAVRQIAGSWVAWQISMDVREGALSMRLLRPVHPLWAYLSTTISATPLRALISLPWTLVLLYAVGGEASEKLARDPASIALVMVSIALALLVSFCISAFVGTLALFFESAMSLWELFTLSFMLASGYLIPLALFPEWARHALAWTPFPYMLAVPVEIFVGMRRGAEALHAIAAQAAYGVVLLGVLLLEWRIALRRYAAYGG